ncbi:MAG: RNA polymerase sigma factor [Candidatus Aminicenantales bacterium]
MDQNENKVQEFKSLIDRFSRFINIHIQKFNLYKLGLDANDILQEIKIKIWKVLDSEKKITNYASYIKKIVDSSVIDQIRKIKREEGIYNCEINKRISEQKNSYLSRLSHTEKDLKEIVGRAVDSLIESRRKVVKLYFLSMTIEEIAHYFHWSNDKTRNLLYRGLSDLKKKLKEREIDYEDHP